MITYSISMARKRNDADPVPPLVTPGYVKILREAVAQDDIPGVTELAAEAGMGRASIWRVLHRPEPPALKTTFRLRQAVENVSGRTLPPPVVPVESEAHYQWIAKGSSLARLNPDLFAELLEIVTASATSLEEAEAQDTAAMARLKSLRRK